jgi:hypothetical protein
MLATIDSEKLYDVLFRRGKGKGMRGFLTRFERRLIVLIDSFYRYMLKVA